MRRILAALILLAGLAGCSAAPPSGGAASAVHLTATLVSPNNVKLDWQGSEPGAAGYALEYATAPGGPFTVLQFVPAGQTTYTHPDLMPQTTFYYRLRPYLGPTSAPVEVTLPPGDFDENAQKDDQEWAKPRVGSGGVAATQSIRNPDTAGAAAPTGFTATIKDANGIQFAWTDHASDEEGYLLEVRPADSSAFGVADVLDPNVSGCGLVTLPNEKHAWYRVRPFYYGPQSNVVHQTTGAGTG